MTELLSLSSSLKALREKWKRLADDRSGTAALNEFYRGQGTALQMCGDELAPLLLHCEANERELYT
jgi:hypothetical protein